MRPAGRRAVRPARFSASGARAFRGSERSPVAPLSAVVAAVPSRAVLPVERPLDLAVLGCGVVGRAFLGAAVPAVRSGLLRIVSVSDRSGSLRDPGGLDPLEVLAAKDAGGFEPGLPVAADVLVDLGPGRWEEKDPAAHESI